MIWNINKQANKQTNKQSEQEKRIKKNEDSVKGASGTTTSIPTFTSQGYQIEKRQSKKLEICLKK